MPPVLLGYRHDKGGAPALLTVFLMLKPPLQRPGSRSEELQSGEQEDVRRYATRCAFMVRLSNMDACAR